MGERRIESGSNPHHPINAGGGGGSEVSLSAYSSPALSGKAVGCKLQPKQFSESSSLLIKSIIICIFKNLYGERSHIGLLGLGVSRWKLFLFFFFQLCPVFLGMVMEVPHRWAPLLHTAVVFL